MQPTSLNVNSRPIKAYEDNGLVYPVAPIQELIRLEIKSLNADRVKQINLSDYLDIDLMAFLVKIDFASDNRDNLSDGTETMSTTPSVNVDMLFKDEDNTTTERMRLTHGGYLNSIDGLLFRKDQSLQIKTDVSLSSLTYYCRPVYQNSIINIVVADASNSRNEP